MRGQWSIVLTFFFTLFGINSSAHAKQEKDTYPNGKVRSIVNKDNNGRKHGVVKYFYKNGQLEEETHWKHGERHGVKKEWYDDGKPEYEGHYKDGNKDGLEKKWYSDGRLYFEGMYKGNDYHGKVKRYRDGKLDQVTQYKYGKKDGKDIEYHSNGKIESIDHYKNGRKQGKSIDYFDSGKAKRVTMYKDDKKLGVEKLYFDNGKIKSAISYKGYTKDGTYKVFHKSGKYDERGKFKNGKKDGKFYEYSSKGILAYLTTYTEGKRNGKYIEFYTDGKKPKKKRIRFFKNDKLDGKYREYYANGKPLYKGQYKEDKKIGKWKFYLDTGKLRTEEFYNDEGRLDGEKKLYHLNGKLQELTVYENGDYKSSKEFYKNGKEIPDQPGTFITEKTKTAKYTKHFFAVDEEVEVIMVRVGPKEHSELLVKIIGVDHEWDGKVLVARSKPETRRSKCLSVWNEETKKSWCLFRTEDVVWSIKKMDMYLTNEKMTFLKSGLFKKENRKKTKVSPKDLLSEFLKGSSKS